jgi:predicted lipoprotein with Yx(FWY)xxD motif
MVTVDERNRQNKRGRLQTSRCLGHRLLRSVAVEYVGTARPFSPTSPAPPAGFRSTVLFGGLIPTDENRSSASGVQGEATAGSTSADSVATDWRTWLVIGSRRYTVNGAGALALTAVLLAACSSATGAGSNGGGGGYGAPGYGKPAATPAPAAAVSGASSGAANGGGAYGASDYGKPAATPTPAAAAAGASVYEVKTASGSVGTYLTGEDGKTLYVFKKDSANTSVCEGGCAANWPPFTLDPGESTKAGAGVTGSLTTFTRTDGKKQVAYKGAPVYYFAGDAKAGDTNGQGVGGAWFVAQP